MIFVTDRTSFGDSFAINLARPRSTCMHRRISSWDDVADILFGQDEASLSEIYISGHGANGGIQANGDYLTADNVTPRVAALIRRVLRPGGRVILMSCEAGADTEMPRLARELGVPVVGNTGCVNWGGVGAGSWVQFNP